MSNTKAKPTEVDRELASRDLARLINDHLLGEFGDEEGYPIELNAREVRAFIDQHWERIARYAHLIHGD